MGEKQTFRKNYAVSEIVGGMLLIFIAVLAFASIYMYLYPPGPDISSHVKIEGYVNDQGAIVLEHAGGDALTNFKIIVKEPNGKSVGSIILTDEKWKIGQYKYPLDEIGRSDIKLIGETDLEVTVYTKNKDGKYQQIFNGILSGKIEQSDPNIILLSSLKQNTVDEDLLCFGNHINTEIDNPNYIYRWEKNSNSIHNIIMPFNIDNSSIAIDYSGNNNNATVYNANWSSNGQVGGCYEFDGNDYLSLPTCFESNYIDDITIETWIKTNSSGAVASFDKEKLWEIDISDEGKIIWSTTANSITVETEGSTVVNDNNWHHIVVTFSSSTGEKRIYVDGELDEIQTSHGIGESLGDGTPQNGYIGKSHGGEMQASWNTLTYDDFEDGWGNYTDGGWDCTITDDEKHQGTYSAQIRDDSRWASSFYHTDGIDLDSFDYTQIKVDFWWLRSGNYWDWGYDEDWWVRYYTGYGWNTVLDMNYPGGYSQDTWYHKILYINESDYNFPDDMKLQFRCDATSNYDLVYIDQIYVNVTTGTTGISNFSGYLDEFRIYDHTLSQEQIYQNYIFGENQDTAKNVMVSEETSLGDIWKCRIIPNNSLDFGSIVESNTLEIKNYMEG